MTAKQIVDQFCKESGFTIEELTGPEKGRMISHARGHLMAKLHDHGWSMLRIANFLNKDHTTVLYWLRNRDKAEAYLAKLPGKNIIEARRRLRDYYLKNGRKKKAALAKQGKLDKDDLMFELFLEEVNAEMGITLS